MAWRRMWLVCLALMWHKVCLGNANHKLLGFFAGMASFNVLSLTCAFLVVRSVCLHGSPADRDDLGRQRCQARLGDQNEFCHI